MSIKISQLTSLSQAADTTSMPVIDYVSGTLTTLQASAPTLRTYFTSNLAANLNATIANVTALQANAVSQESEIYAVGTNVSVLQNQVSILQSNVVTLFANTVTVAGEIYALSTNVGILQGNVTTINFEINQINSNVSAVNATIANISANITVTNANVTTVASNVANLQISSYSNVNVTAYLTTATITTTGNVAAGYLFGNGFSIYGINTYSNIKVNALLNTVASANAVIVANTGGNVTSVSPGTSGNVLTSNGANWISGATYIRTTPTTVANLGFANVAGAGARAFVTDANTVTFNSAVIGGFGNSVPVFSNGTVWRIG